MAVINNEIGIKINGKFMSLSSGFKLKIRKTSPIFGIGGGYTLPGVAPIDENNISIFGFGHRLNVFNTKRSFECEIWTGQLIHGKGILSVETYSEDGIDFNIEVPPGNIPAETWNMSIKKFDIGSFTFSITRQISNIYSVKIDSADIKILGTYYKSVYYVRIAGQETLEFLDRTAPEDSAGLAERLSSLSFEFNNIYKDFEMVVSDSGVSIIGDALDSVNIDYYGFLQSNPATPDITKTFTFSRVSYDRLNDIHVNDLNDKPFRFQKIQNTDFYQDQNKKFGNWVNQNIEGIYQQNDEFSRTEHSLLPSFSLKYIIEKLCSAVGYIATGSFLDILESEKAYLYTNITLDKQCEGAYVPFNIFNPNLVYANHLPDWTLRDFFDKLRQRFQLLISFDYDDSVSFDFLNDLSSKTDFKDFRNRMPYLPKITPQKRKVQQFQFERGFEFGVSTKTDGSVDLSYFEGILKNYNDFLASPPDADLVSEKSIEKISLALPPLTLYFVAGYKITIPPRRNGGGSIIDIPDEEVLTTKHACVSNLFNFQNNEVITALFFAADASKGVIEKPNLKLSLSYYYDVLFKFQKSINENSQELSFATQLSPAEIAKLDWQQPWHFGAKHWLSEISYELPSGISEGKFLGVE